MTDSWVTGYRDAFWAYYSTHSTVMVPDGWSSGNPDYRASGEMHEHMKECSVDRSLSQFPEENVRYEFNGTDASHSEHPGMETIVWCKCGQYVGVKTRFEGTMSEVITGVLKEAD